MFKTRLITACVALILVLAGIFYLPPLYFLIATSILFLWAAWEWSQFLCLPHTWMRYGYVGVVLILMMIVNYTPVLFVLVPSFLAWCLMAVLVWTYPKTRALWNHSYVTRILISFFALLPAWMSLNVLRTAEEGRILLLFLLCIVWATDTGAYLSGKMWGAKLLLPAVSPKKTREGLYGGLLCAWFTAFVFCMILSVHPLQWIPVMLIAILTALFSVMGDLAESMMKRQVGLKDSGTLFPGHGGLLDRIDSLLAAAPIFLLGFWILPIHMII